MPVRVLMGNAPMNHIIVYNGSKVDVYTWSGRSDDEATSILDAVTKFSNDRPVKLIELEYLDKDKEKSQLKLAMKIQSLVSDIIAVLPIYVAKFPAYVKEIISPTFDEEKIRNAENHLEKGRCCI